MSRIDGLIKELAPEGVEFKPLGDVGEFIRGNGLQKSDLTAQGAPAIHYGQLHTHYGIWTDTTKSFTDPTLATKLRRAKPGDLIIATTSEDDAAVAKATAWIGDGEVAVSGDAYIYRHSLDPRYVAYFFQSDKFQGQKTRHVSGTKVRRISGTSLAKIRIPVPPLEVQREIVRILGQFTALEAELEAELEARRAQYEHYSGILLDPTSLSDARLHRVGDICQVSRGQVISKDYLSDHPGPHAVYSSQTQNGGIFGYIDSFAYDFESITWTTDGANAGSVFFHQDEKFTITNVCGLLRVRDPGTVSARYLFYQLRKRAKSHVSAGMGNPKLMANAMSAIRIPLPSLAEQEQVADLLNKFDALVNDLSVGLPAELTARRKQYEYYRDKLLTFEEATV